MVEWLKLVGRHMAFGMTLAALSSSCAPVADEEGTEPVGEITLAASLPVYSQQAYAKPFNTGAGDAFGALGLSKDGNVMIVGADGEDGNSTGIEGPSNELAADSGAAYVLVRSGNTWWREAYVKASNTGAGDSFGHAVAISGDGNTIAIAAPLEDSSSTGINQSGANDAAPNSGAVYVFTRTALGPVQQAYIKASNAQTNDTFGWSVALSENGDTLAVGARTEDSGVVGNANDNSMSDAGAVYVFQRSSGVWAQQAYVKAANVGAGDNFGGSVSLAANGSTLAVGAAKEDTNGQGVGPAQNNNATDSGAAYVFTRSGSTWTQQSFIKAHNHASVIDYFGVAVRLSGNGNTLAVGSAGEDSAAIGINGDASSNSRAESGAVFTYTRSGSTWSTQTYFKAHNANASDAFGDNLALSFDGTRLAITALGEDSSATGVGGNALNEAASASGAVYTYALIYGSWVFTNYVKASNTGANDSFGSYLALSQDGSTLAVGAVNEDSSATNFGGNQASNAALDSGSVYVLTTSSSVVTYAQQAYVKPSNTQASDGAVNERALSLSGDGNTLALGARFEDSNAILVGGNQANNSAAESGAAYVYTRSGETWATQAYIKASNTQADDSFGFSIALSTDGNTLAVGAPGEDSNALLVGGDEANNVATNSGAVYIYVRSAGVWSKQAYIKASNTGASDSFGTSVALSGDGNTLAVGAFFEASSAIGVGGNQANDSAAGAGAAYVYTRSGSTWTHQAYIKASNTDALDFFGGSIALSQDSNTLIVGATGEDSSLPLAQLNNTALDSGAAYYFRRTGSLWIQHGYLKALQPGAGDAFGSSVSVSGDGNKVAVGATGDDSNAIGIGGQHANESAPDTGAAYVYQYPGFVTPTYFKASNASGSFGVSVQLSADGASLAVGASYESGPSREVNGAQAPAALWNSGAVYAFKLTSGTWAQQAYLKATNAEADDLFGTALGLSQNGNTLAAYAPLEDSNATSINGQQWNNSALDSGAVYVFER